MYPDFEFENLKKEYLLNLYSPMLKGHKYIIDKTPRYWEILEEIRELFPNSKMLILKRNPVKVAESIFKTWNVDTLERMLIFKRDLLHGPFAIKSFEDKHAGKPTIYFLSYEKLINNTEIEVEKLYRWLGTPFDKDFLKVQNNRKVQGKYGDPFLNSELGYTAAKRKSDLIELNNIQQKFLH
ncbi:sulfotransferase family protein, partial [Longispora fulva]|uniref:sulfotransferase family protein n=2 Tax=Bacteria TaxID=2 RepID=UPI00363DD353